MDPNRKFWNEQQQKLQRTLARPEDHQKAVGLFLDHHAMVHSAKMSQTGLWSFDDEVLEGLTEADIRSIPENEEHSIAWVIWHIARIEDVTMNVLVAGSPQLLNHENWLEKMKVTTHETGNALNATGIADLSTAIDVDELRAYRVAVGRRTREIVKKLQPGEFKQKVQPVRLEQVMAEEAVVEATRWLTDYWSEKTIAGLLLMPPTRHNFIHLNEAARLKQKLR
jgi:hypothetical protein